MRIEHVALQVADPAAAAAWYEKNLGFTVRRAGGAPAHVRFIADASGSVMLEIYNNPRMRTPDYASMDPLLLHLAFESDDIEADRDRLLAAGATLVEDVTTIPTGDRVLMMRDPWGLAIQAVTRSQRMLG
ncbi:MAG: VOC family protein [Lentisphaerae bacterium]|nr:VOC family protein [Lentisphaerota bacterium]